MKRLLGVALVVMAVLWVRRTGTAGTDPSTTALALGFTLIAAMVAGELLRRFRLPRLTGYLLFGMLVGPYLGNVITMPMARAAPDGQRHRDGADRVHCRADAQLRAARPPRGGHRRGHRHDHRGRHARDCSPWPGWPGRGCPWPRTPQASPSSRWSRCSSSSSSASRRR